MHLFAEKRGRDKIYRLDLSSIRVFLRDQQAQNSEVIGFVLDQLDDRPGQVGRGQFGAQLVQVGRLEVVEVDGHHAVKLVVAGVTMIRPSVMLPLSSATKCRSRSAADTFLMLPLV